MLLLNFFKKKRKVFYLAIVISIVVVVFVLAANQAHAQISNLLPWNWGKATLSAVTNISFYLITKLLMGVTYVIWFVFAAIMQLAAWFLDWVLSSSAFTAFTRATIVTTGWTITRDLANMFFALILLIVSFATILRIESYGIKQILPKLIIAALLINFSLVIAGVIIDFTQSLTTYFINSATSGGALVAREIGEALNIYDLTESPDTLEDAAAGSLNALLLFIPNLFMGIVVFLVAAFVLFAAAILLIVRVVALWFLLILAPLAWIFSILPSTRSYWNMWWSSFFKWAFFAPAFAFFYYLSIMVIRSGALRQDAGIQAVNAGITNSSRIFDLSFLIDYVIIIGLLLGGLIIAQKMGVWGAGAMIGVAKSGGSWARRQAMRPVKYGAAGTAVGAAGAAAGATALASRLATTLGLKKTQQAFEKMARRMEAKSKQIRISPLEEPQHKAYKKLLDTMSGQDILREAETAKGIRSLIAARTAKEKNLIKGADVATAQKIKETLESFRMAKDAKEIEQVRPDTITEPRKISEAIKDAIREGNLNMISHLALKNEEVVKAIAENASSPRQIEDLRNKSKEHETALIGSLDKLSASLRDNRAVQFAYASQKGDVSRMNTSQKAEWAQKTGAEGLKRIQKFDVTVTENIPANKLRSVLENLTDGKLAHDIADHIRKTSGAAGHQLANNDPYIKNL